MGYPFRSRLEHEPLGEISVVQMKDIDEANLLHPDAFTRVSLPDAKSRHLLQPGDLLFRSRGKSNGAALVRGGIGAAVLAAPMLLIRPHSIDPEYLCWFINTDSTQAQLTTMSEGTAVRMISAEALRRLAIPSPPLAVQKQIVQIAFLADQERTLMSEIAKRRQQLTFHLLLQRAQQYTPKAQS